MTLRPLLLAALALGLFAEAATASSLQSADFRPGHTMAIGLAGLSYDYAFHNISLGLGVLSGTESKPMPTVRGLMRFFEAEGTSAAVLAGVTARPASYGNTQSIAPDLGLSLAHRFAFGNGNVAVAGQPLSAFRFTLRVNMTLTAAPRNAFYIVPGDPAPLGNLFQRLNLGPQTSIALAVDQSEHLELTLGGGTLVGMRVIF